MTDLLGKTKHKIFDYSIKSLSILFKNNLLILYILHFNLTRNEGSQLFYMWVIFLSPPFLSFLPFSILPFPLYYSPFFFFSLLFYSALLYSALLHTYPKKNLKVKS